MSQLKVTPVYDPKVSMYLEPRMSSTGNESTSGNYFIRGRVRLFAKLPKNKNREAAQAAILRILALPAIIAAKMIAAGRKIAS